QLLPMTVPRRASRVAPRGTATGGYLDLPAARSSAVGATPATVTFLAVLAGAGMPPANPPRTPRAVESESKYKSGDRAPSKSAVGTIGYSRVASYTSVSVSWVQATSVRPNAAPIPSG